MSGTVAPPRLGAVRLGFRGLVDGEWIKLRSLRSTSWVVGVTAVMMISMAVTMALSVGSTSRLDAPAVAGMATGGVTGAQFAVMLLGVFAITGEYRTGQIRSTFNADPRRTRVLAAKAVVVALTAFVTAVVSTVVSLVVAHVILLVRGSAPGFLDYVDLEVWRVLLGAPLYLVFVAVASLACGAALRRSAAAVTAVLGILWMLPGTAVMFEGSWVTTLVSFLPASAGAALYSTDSATGEMDVFGAMSPASGVELAPWQGLFILLAYLALFWAVGMAAVKRKDV